MAMYIIISSIIGLAIGGLFSLLYKNREKKDAGFVYYGLSYRRKMIRTLWMFPVVLLFLIIFSAINERDIIGEVLVWISLLLLFSAQLFYTYYKWKKEERDIEAG